MKISILVEGKTERAFKPHLVDFLKPRLAGRMPLLHFSPCDGRIDTGEKIRRTVENLLTNGKSPSGAVIALTDVYTGTNDFIDAADARNKCSNGWGIIANFIRMPCSTISKPGYTAVLEGHSETCRPQQSCAIGCAGICKYGRPPSSRIKEIFELGHRSSYSKARDATRILRLKISQLPGTNAPN